MLKRDIRITSDKNRQQYAESYIYTEVISQWDKPQRNDRRQVNISYWIG